MSSEKKRTISKVGANNEISYNKQSKLNNGTACKKSTNRKKSTKSKKRKNINKKSRGTGKMLQQQLKKVQLNLNQIWEGYHKSGGMFVGGLGRRGDRRRYGYAKHTFWELFQFDPTLCRKLDECNNNYGSRRTVLYSHVRSLKASAKRMKMELKKRKRDRVYCTCLCFESKMNRQSRPIFVQLRKCVGRYW